MTLLEQNSRPEDSLGDGVDLISDLSYGVPMSKIKNQFPGEDGASLYATNLASIFLQPIPQILEFIDVPTCMASVKNVEIFFMPESHIVVSDPPLERLDILEVYGTTVESSDNEFSVGESPVIAAKSNGNFTIAVSFHSCLVGNTDGILRVYTNVGILRVPLFAHTVPNILKLRPKPFLRVLAEKLHTENIDIFNPTTGNLVITNVICNGGSFSLAGSSSIDRKKNEWTIPPLEKRTVAKMQFRSDITGVHRGMIRIDLVRVTLSQSKGKSRDVKQSFIYKTTVHNVIGLVSVPPVVNIGLVMKNMLHNVPLTLRNEGNEVIKVLHVYPERYIPGLSMQISSPILRPGEIVDIGQSNMVGRIADDFAVNVIIHTNSSSSVNAKFKVPLSVTVRFGGLSFDPRLLTHFLSERDEKRQVLLKNLFSENIILHDVKMPIELQGLVRIEGLVNKELKSSLTTAAFNVVFIANKTVHPFTTYLEMVTNLDSFLIPVRIISGYLNLSAVSAIGPVTTNTVKFGITGMRERISKFLVLSNPNPISLTINRIAVTLPNVDIAIIGLMDSNGRRVETPVQTTLQGERWKCAFFTDDCCGATDPDGIASGPCYEWLPTSGDRSFHGDVYGHLHAPIQISGGGSLQLQITLVSTVNAGTWDGKLLVGTRKGIETIQNEPHEMEVPAISQYFPVSGETISGTIALSPFSISFDPSFSNKQQIVNVYARNYFNVPVEISEVHNTDDVFQVTLSDISNPVVIPNSYGDERAYSTDDLDIHEDGHHGYYHVASVVFNGSRMLDDYIERSGMESWSKHLHLSTSLTEETLNVFRSRYRLHQSMQAEKRLQRSGILRLPTNLTQHPYEVIMQARLVLPSLVVDFPLEFSDTQVGGSSFKSINVHNPSDESIALYIYSLNVALDDLTMDLDGRSDAAAELLASVLEINSSNNSVLDAVSSRAPSIHPSLIDFAYYRNTADGDNPECILQTKNELRGVEFTVPSSRERGGPLIIAPHRSIDVPIMFQPSSLGIFQSTVVLANNLTVLDFVTLRGKGSSGCLGFDVVNEQSFNSSISSDNNILLFDISNEDLMPVCTRRYEDRAMTFEGPLYSTTRHLRSSNTGALPVVGYTSISSQHNDLSYVWDDITDEYLSITGWLNETTFCSGGGFTILPCGPFRIDPGSALSFSVIFSPDFQSSVHRSTLYIQSSTGASFMPLLAMLPGALLSSCRAHLPVPAWATPLYILITLIICIYSSALLLFLYREFMSEKKAIIIRSPQECQSAAETQQVCVQSISSDILVEESERKVIVEEAKIASDSSDVTDVFSEKCEDVRSYDLENEGTFFEHKGVRAPPLSLPKISSTQHQRIPIDIGIVPPQQVEVSTVEQSINMHSSWSNPAKLSIDDRSVWRDAAVAAAADAAEKLAAASLLADQLIEAAKAAEAAKVAAATKAAEMAKLAEAVGFVNTARNHDSSLQCRPELPTLHGNNSFSQQLFYQNESSNESMFSFKSYNERSDSLRGDWSPMLSNLKRDSAYDNDENRRSPTIISNSNQALTNNYRRAPLSPRSSWESKHYTENTAWPSFGGIGNQNFTCERDLSSSSPGGNDLSGISGIWSPSPLFSGFAPSPSSSLQSDSQKTSLFGSDLFPNNMHRTNVDHGMPAQHPMESSSNLNPSPSRNEKIY